MELIQNLFAFYEKFEEEKGYIGFTEKGYPIPYFAVRKTDYPVLIITGAIHAREYVTGSVVLKTAKYLQKTLRQGKVYAVPVANADGVKITKVLPLYKANARGTDLNTNFPARWGTGEFNVKVKGQSGFVGEYTLSESETQALASFTERIKPDITLSLHTKGEEIYYDFFDDELEKRDRRFADVVAKITGYKIVMGLKSSGGYKDFCVERYKIPSLTVEAAPDFLSHPIGEEYVDEIFEKVKDVPSALIEEMLKLNGRD